MSTSRLIPAALLAVVLGAALTGCGDDAPESTTKDKSSAAATGDAGQGSTADADGATDATDTASGSTSPSGSASPTPIGSGTLGKDDWKKLCLLTNDEVNELAPSFGPYPTREGGFVNLDTSGAPVDLSCTYQSKADRTSGVQITARPYVEKVDAYDNPNDYATPVEAWEDACDDGDFDCGNLPGQTPYAIFGTNGFGALYPEGTYYFQVAVMGDPAEIKAAEVKAVVSALEDKVG